MTLVHVLALVLFTLLTGWILPWRWRVGLILIVSLLVMYALQPATTIRNLGFWLPTLGVGLTLLVWAITQEKEIDNRTTLLASILIFGTVVILALTRYMGQICCLTAARPPQLHLVLVSLFILIALFLGAMNLRGRKFASWVIVLIILSFFLILKTETLANRTSAILRTLSGQDASLASSMDIQWIGFSYLAFRLLHVLRDFQAGRLVKSTLPEFVVYAFFFPAFLAGPIDRFERFINDLRANLLPEDLLQGCQRILLGVFKKFVLADSLALLALNSQNSEQITSSLWMWVALYAFALRIYLDFSGYTDIALGLGRLLGIHLPENFLSPYTKTNLTAFWNSWHITLAQWFRSYFFNPLTRALRANPRKLPPWSIVLIGQVGVMLLIGLWHGVTWNFALWGLWHAAGLFVHNRWLDWRKSHFFSWEIRPASKAMLSLSGWMLTFQYVTLGWVWFALPDFRQSWQVLQILFGRS